MSASNGKFEVKEEAMSAKVQKKSLNILNDSVGDLQVAGQQTPALGMSRRSFLKVLGSASALGAVGCADKATQNIFPNVKGDDQQIPGVSVWYSSTCTECDAGCGIKVRTREGRAVKIEGNPNHPVNRGGLCALGQSALQDLYDPDRIRQPLKRGATGFEPITWDEAYTEVAGWVKDAKKQAFVGGESSGALDELLADFSGKFGVDRYAWDLLQPTAVAKAAELVFGVYGIPSYKIDRAQTVVNFGSDFLETWVSPCEYARDWAKGRKSKKPIRVVHVEPRLSLTGANADLWLSAKPGSEVRIALAILKLLLERGKGEEQKAALQKLTADVHPAEIAEESGVKFEKIVLVAQYLADSEASLVLAGGTAASANNALELAVVCNFINLILGNVGKTIQLAKARVPKTSLSKMQQLIASLGKGEVDVLFTYGSNPVFTLPASYGFKYAAKKAGRIVSFSSHMDETAELADIILPSNSGLETWGDSRAIPGVYSLQQPSMVPVFNTKVFGDSIIEIASRAGKAIAISSGKDFQAYLKDSWKKLHASFGAAVNSDFSKFWVESLERGGYFPESKEDSKKPQVSAKAYEIALESAAFGAAKGAEGEVLVYPYPSVKTFDGRAANRPWMQELPDPITQAAWDSWAEIHPDTAKSKGLANGDFVNLRNYFGEINVPVYVTKHVLPGVVAVPLGQGHTSYGRFAKKVQGGNVLDLIPVNIKEGSDSLALLSAKAEISRGRGKADLVIVQGSDSQMGRELARTDLISAATHDDHHDHEEHGHGAEHHEPKQMYEQRPHPLYKWGMAIDLATCTGCASCVVACYAENNIPVVGKARMNEGREMSWLRIERYYDNDAEELQVSFLPMMCQQCGNAPCEPVCPVYATYHNEEGLNSMVYNRCVGTRYCSNNCSYKVRRFNWFEYELPSPLDMQLNPDVMKRTVGVMEKCTFCVQRIAEAKDHAKDLGRQVEDGEIQPACVQGCATQAMVFGNLNDPNSRVSKMAQDGRAYKVLDHHLNTQPAITYLNNIRYKA